MEASLGKQRMMCDVVDKPFEAPFGTSDCSLLPEALMERTFGSSVELLFTLGRICSPLLPSLPPLLTEEVPASELEPINIGTAFLSEEILFCRLGRDSL